MKFKIKTNYEKFILITILFISCELNSQIVPNFDCGMISPSGANTTTSNPFKGLFKPIRTDLSGDSSSPANAYFPVIIVFVQFQNDDNGINWPSGQPPTYLDSLIASPADYNNQSSWWNAYNENTQMFSDMYQEISRGKQHILGKAFSVVLSHQASYYTSDTIINTEIWDSLQVKIPDWKIYDRWQKGSDGKFRYRKDNSVDMIFKIHKTRNSVMYPREGFSQLSSGSQMNDTIDADDTIYINHGYSQLGSGVTISFNSSKALLSEYIYSIKHEFAHYTIAAGHYTYSVVNYGIGGDGFYSPYDMILSRYMVPQTLNYSGHTSFSLEDYTSRNSDTLGNILKLPIQNDEYFLIVSRRKVSRWDRVVVGDTVGKIGFYNDFTEYGKGVYIYHVENGIFQPGGNISPQDMECADGYFKWDSLPAGTDYVHVITTCFQSPLPDWPYFDKKYPLYINDKSIIESTSPVGDGISFNYKISSKTWPKWWSNGKKEENLNPCLIGTEGILTNTNEIYVANAAGGDRWDAWNIGYNEVFSPYSSPSTASWNNSETGIFVWHDTLIGSTSKLKIYRASENGGSTSLASILEYTPPSRPMGLRVLPCDSLPMINDYLRIKLTWNHNMEPDMVPTFGTENKKYKIYRNYTSTLDSVPKDAIQYSENYYQLIKTVEINKNIIPTYIDSLLVSGCVEPPDAACPPICWTRYPVRYRVQAIDVYNDASVLSDFAKTEAWLTTESEGGDEGENEGRMLSQNENIPKVYSLKQNYPNPFNPYTNIQYDLPFDNFVTIKVFDILGKEVITLINEFKNAGSYIVSFNGLNLSSGIYYYKIEADSYTAIRKMLLIK